MSYGEGLNVRTAIEPWRFLRGVKHRKKKVTYVFENRAVPEAKRYKECSRAGQQNGESAAGSYNKR
jgi:hypothetical protein